MGAAGRKFEHQRRLPDAREQRQHQWRSGDRRDACRVLSIRPADLQERPRVHARERRRMPDERKRWSESDRSDPVQRQRESRRKLPEHLLMGAIDTRENQSGRGNVQGVERVWRRRYDVSGRSDDPGERDPTVAGERAGFPCRQISRRAPRTCRSLACSSAAI